MDGVYRGVITIEPGSLADAVCRLIFWQRQRTHMAQTKLLALASLHSKNVRDAATEYMESINPALRSAGDQFLREMSEIQENIHEIAEEVAHLRLRRLDRPAEETPRPGKHTL